MAACSQNLVNAKREFMNVNMEAHVIEAFATQLGIRSISVKCAGLGSEIVATTSGAYGQAVATRSVAPVAIFCFSLALLAVAWMEASGANEIVASANIFRYTLLV